MKRYEVLSIKTLKLRTQKRCCGRIVLKGIKKKITGSGAGVVKKKINLKKAPSPPALLVS